MVAVMCVPRHRDRVLSIRVLGAISLLNCCIVIMWSYPGNSLGRSAIEER